MCPPSSFPTAESTTPSAINTDFVPPTDIAQAAFKTSSHVAPSILNHSIRVYLHASALAKSSDSVYALTNNPAKHDLLFTACILHDIGTCDTYDGPQRFEVEGADGAVALLRSFQVDEKDIHDVWVAIAIHTSAGIAERIHELARLVREAVLIDFGKLLGGDEVVELKKQVEEAYPRLGVEKELGNSVVGQAVRRPGKAPPASWPGILYRSHLAEPEWKGVNKAF
ncbi:hypothetical protein V5O48_009462 [Marasmius crinis-equi]|uniref:HD/PDEase domain-containing protein n=1 Tax=Marasmius crinis-equi TaxID=585013 RepID=A0ABR3FB09_9AGAR